VAAFSRAAGASGPLAIFSWATIFVGA
jgi:hypothetical protein